MTLLRRMKKKNLVRFRKCEMQAVRQMVQGLEPVMIRKRNLAGRRWRTKRKRKRRLIRIRVREL